MLHLAVPTHWLAAALGPRLLALLPAGEAEEEGYDDEYQLEDVEVSPADYIKPAFAPNFRAGWEALPEDSEMVDDYGIGQRDSLQVGLVSQSAGAECGVR